MNLRRLPSLNQSLTFTFNNDQLFNDENNRSVFGDRLITLNQNFYSDNENCLKIRTQEKKEEREYEDYIEIWEGNDEGLIWGRKEAKDKSWNEEWIEQRNIPKKSNKSQISSSESEQEIVSTNNTQIERCVSQQCQHIGKFEQNSGSLKRKNNKDKKASLGQLKGVNYKENKRWKEKWFKRGSRLFVRKYFEKLCENNENVIETWFEDSEFKFEKKNENENENDEMKWKLVRINKYGKNILNSREWREYTFFDETHETMIFQEKNSDSAPDNNFLITKKTKRSLYDNSKVIYKKYIKGENSNDSTINLDMNFNELSEDKIGDDFNEKYFDNKRLAMLKNNFENLEICEEYIEIEDNGDKRGRKYEFKTDNVDCYEVWFEKVDGTKENDCWFLKEGDQWGEKSGYSKSNNEYFTVKWEQKKDEFQDSKFIRKTWEKPGENDSWGESYQEIIDYNENFKNKMIKKQVKIKKENWYNNGIENFKEEFFEESKYEDDIMKNQEKPIKIFRNGKKEGERITTKETWCEDWEEHLEKFEENDHLIRINHSTNKWWKNQNDKWGEVRTLKLKPKDRLLNREYELNSEINKKTEDEFEEKHNSYIEIVKTWKRSELEESFDSWVVDGQLRHGQKKSIVKEKDNNGYSEWQENWSKDQKENLTKNSIWKKYDEYGLIEFWEEEQILEDSGKFNSKKWGGKYNIDDRTEIEQEWEEKFEDDGKGNTRTIKKGNGKESWYLDEFGKSELTGEQWASKQGYDAEGSWEEKWLEKPDYKEAWKKGENCYGDIWEEEWKEDFKNKWKWAKKSGQNNLGDEWKEEWREETDTVNNVSRKTALKKGRKLYSGEEWSEEWGESYYGIGNEYMGDGGLPAEFVEKWTNKYAMDGNGNVWGDSWGDNWRWDSKIKSWGEKWYKDQIIEKW